jgi:hypothetical protein
MKIGIMSDSHKDTRHTARLIEHLMQNGAQYLIHAGDFEEVENLRLLHDAGLPYVSVFGNNDHRLVPYQNRFCIYPEPHYFTIGTLRFKLMHRPVYLAKEEADIVVYGHTHQVNIKYNDGLLLLNPGELCARETDRHEALLLEVSKERYLVTHFFLSGGNDTFQEKITEFSRT